MYRIPRIPLLAAACTIALAACSDSVTGPGQGARDPELIAANRNLGGGTVVTSVKKSDKVTRGTTPRMAAAACCDCAHTTQASDPMMLYPYPYECPTPTPTPIPYDPPGFSVWTSIGTSSSYGTKYVTLSATGDFWYASYGEMSTSFRNAGGCYSTPSEYTNAYQFSYNAPFTLASSRSASYNGTVSAVNWQVTASAYAETPGGGWDTRYHSSTVCY